MTRATKTVCEWCGRKFDPPSIKGPKPKYCSPSHRQQAYLKRHGFGTK